MGFEMLRNFELYVIYLILGCIFSLGQTEDLLGCGGFIKSDIEINFSEVVVQLYTKQGALKDQTDCAPNSGYYFLPVYDKGEYVLKIDPKAGWKFEPQEVHVNVNGVNDHCSLGNDINFVFTGFAISGKVVSSGSDIGPQSVVVSLLSESGTSVVQENTTRKGGSFLFSPVLPGKYMIVASHKSWLISRNKAKIVVDNANVDVPVGELAVEGYDVSGSVTSDKQPINGVKFILFSDNVNLKTKISGCEKIAANTGYSEDAVCCVFSDNLGQFLFPVVPTGFYVVRPYYQGPHNIDFDVRPKEMSFEVSHGSVILDEVFQVMGFSVQGRILSRRNGYGIVGAKLFLDGELNSYTGSNGYYHLQGLQSGTYKLLVEADNMKFKEIIIRISPHNLHIPDLYPSLLKVCGHITPPPLDSGYLGNSIRVAYIFRSYPSKDFIASIDIQPNEEIFCHYLEPGRYEISIKATEWEHSNGMQFHPVSHIVEVIDAPVMSGIEFSQLKINLHILVTCISVNSSVNCPDVALILRSVNTDDEDDDMNLYFVETVVKNGVHVFENISPGKYEINVLDENVCWNMTQHVAYLQERDSYVHFVQTGFRVVIMSSHDTKVRYQMQGSEDGKDSAVLFDATSGTSKICVDLPGVYEFMPAGCHGYAQSVFLWNTSTVPVVPIKMIAVSHTMNGIIISKENVSDMYMNVSSEDGLVSSKLGPLKAELELNKFKYHFELLAKEGEHLIFEPFAGLLLFEPPKTLLIAPNNCMPKAVEFQAYKGKMVEGKIEPPVTDVSIVVSSGESNNIVTTTTTDKNGTFKVGPLSPKLIYRITAEKEGFVFVEQDVQGYFTAHKLAEINVEILESSNKEPLQGVLLSLSGGKSFRRNSQTNSKGKLTFTSLSPDEYFLRPVLKEYRFEPPSKLITVKQGASVIVQMLGHRVAHSIYGSVTSLSGEPEEGVPLEALGFNECSQYQEDGTTELNGNFRIRGIQPHCDYVVGMKRASLANQQFLRTSPNLLAVKAPVDDIKGLKLTVFHPVSQMDVFVTVESSSLEYLVSVSLKLCREESADSPVYIFKLDSLKLASFNNGCVALMQFSPIPSDGQNYFVHLESSLSHVYYVYSDIRSNVFKAQGAFKHIRLVFEPILKHNEPDVKQESYFLLPLMIILGFLCWYERAVFFAAYYRIQIAGSPSHINHNVNRTNPIIHPSSDAVIVEPVISISKRKSRSRKT